MDSDYVTGTKFDFTIDEKMDRWILLAIKRASDAEGRWSTKKQMKKKKLLC